MLVKVILSLCLVAVSLASEPLPYDDQDNQVDPVVPVDTPYGYPYYSGYPFYHSGYPYYHGAYPYHYSGNFPPYYPYYAPVVPAQPAQPYDSTYVFHGNFDGRCNADGLYYVDKRSFAFCHHGQRTVQSCAEGAANKESSKYEAGSYYTMNDFCSVNLLARTTPAPPAPPAPEVPTHGYEEVNA